MDFDIKLKSVTDPSYPPAPKIPTWGNVFYTHISVPTFFRILCPPDPPCPIFFSQNVPTLIANNFSIHHFSIFRLLAGKFFNFLNRVSRELLSPYKKTSFFGFLPHLKIHNSLTCYRIGIKLSITIWDTYGNIFR